MKTVRRQIYDMAAEALDLPVSKFRGDAPWEEYGGDSLAVVEMVLVVQEHYGLTLDGAELGRLKCLDDLVDIVEQKAGKAS